MDRDLHDMDDLFRKALSEHEDAPSVSVWDKLDKDLDKIKVVSITRKYHMLKWVAASLFLVSSAVAMYTWKVNADMKQALRENKERSQNNTARSAESIIGSVKPDSGEASISAGKKYDGVVVEKEQPSANENMEKAPFNAEAADSSTINSTISPGDKTANQLKTDKTTLKKGISSESSAVAVQRNDAAVAGTEDKAGARPGEGDVGSSKGVVTTALQKKKSEELLKENKFASQGNLRLVSDNNTSTKASRLQPGLAEKNQDLSSGKVSREPQPALFTVPRSIAEERNQAMLGSTPFKKVKAPPSVRNADLNISSENLTAAIRLDAQQRPLITLMPFYSFDMVSSKVKNDDHFSREFNRKEIQDKEEIGNSHSIGLLASVAINDNLNIETGLILSSFTTTIKPKTIFAHKDNRGNVSFRFNCSAGYSEVTVKSAGASAPRQGDSVLAMSSTNALQYLSIPLNLRFKLGTGKITVNPGFGLAANFLSSGKIETHIAVGPAVEKTKGNKVQGLNPIYMSGSLSLGVNYAITRSIAATLMPTMRMGLSSINKDLPVRTMLNSYGIGAGLSFSL